MDLDVTRPPNTGGKARCEICVEPQEEWWRLRAPESHCDVVFRSGWQAEVAARALARSLADFGRSSVIRIYIRGGELAGAILAGPDDPLFH